MMMATASLVLMTLFLKQARQSLSGPEVVFWRGLLSLPILLVSIRGVPLKINNKRLFVLRVVVGFSAMVGFAISVKGLSLVDLDLVSKLRPLIIAVAAPVFLGRGERAAAGIWLALVIAFAGCFILLAPDLAVGSPYALWALASVTLSAGAHLCLRGLGKTEHTRVIVFWFHASVAVLAAAVIVASGGSIRLPPSSVWPALVGVAVAATAGQLLMTRAYAIERAPTVAAASYTGPLWATLGDVLVFRAWPGPNAWLGGALVLAASVRLVVGFSRTGGTIRPSPPGEASIDEDVEVRPDRYSLSK
jgi:drug/metabolite transporter (DMT)-like permease